MLFKNGFKRFVVVVFCLFASFLAKSVSAQIDSSDSAGNLVISRFSEIVNEYIVKNEVMSEDIIEKYTNELVKSTEIRRYRSSMSEEAKQKMNMILAFLDYYSGKGDEAVKSAFRVVAAAPDDKELMSCAIYLAYMAKDYTYLDRLVGKSNPGGIVLEAMAKSNSDLQAKVSRELVAIVSAAGSIVSGSSSGYDPNDLSDPNSPASRAARARAQQAATPVTETTTWQDPRSASPRGPRTTFVDPRAQVRDPRAGAVDPRLAAMNNSANTVEAVKLEIDPGYLPIDMLGKQLEKMTLQSVGGSFMLYDPEAGKGLCLLLWGYGDSKAKEQVAEIKEMFKSTGGGFGPIQYASLNCNSSQALPALKLIFEESLSYSAPWPQFIMTPANSSQLSTITPVSGVVLIADSKGIVRFVGPADNLIAKAIIKNEAESVSGDLASFFSESNLSGNIQDIATGIAGQVQNAFTAGTTEYKEDSPANIDIADDPTIVQAQQKLELAKLKAGTPFGLSLKSALDYCDEVLEGWPGTAEAEEAKRIIREVCSKSAARQYVRERIREGKYVGEENEQ